MSEPVTRQDVLQLISSLERLTLAVRGSGLGVVGGLEDWELAEADYQGPGYGAVRNFEVESGPPDTPASLLELGKKLISSKTDGQFRIRRALTAGLWAKISLLCEVALSGPEPIPLRDTQFLVLRAVGLDQPVRVLKIEERDQFVGGDPRALHYGFPSLAEVQAFCCGAGISVPDLYKCRSSGSGSATRVTPRC